MPFEIHTSVGQKTDAFRLQQLPLDLPATESAVPAKGTVSVQDPMAGKSRRGAGQGSPYDPGSAGLPAIRANCP